MTAASQSEIAGAPAAPAAAPCVSAKETLAAFERTQTEQWRCTDLLASLLMPLLTLLVATGPSPAAVAAACLTLALPGALALLSPSRWFARRRNWVVAGCRLASMLLLERAVPPSAPAAPEWPGGLKLLALSRTLSLNLFAWGNRLPLRWLVWVQLACTLQSARICFLHICPSPAFSGPAAQAPLRRMATAAGALRVLLPTPGPLADGAPSCTGACLCQQVVLWLLACFGYALPIMAQMLSQTAALHAFVRRHRRCACRPRCDECVKLLSPDLLNLEVAAALLFVFFCAAAWQAIAAWGERAAQA